LALVINDVNYRENKNYTPIAEKLLREKFDAISINKDSILITTTKVKSCKGEA
jgi:hypothetical protein